MGPTNAQITGSPRHASRGTCCQIHALTGYEELLAQKAEVRSSQRILASDEQEVLAQALVQVKEDLPVKVRVNYYNRKKEKEVELIGTAEKVSELEQTLLVSEQKLDFGQLYRVEILE